MLVSWIVLAIGQLSAAISPLIDATAGASRPTPSSITPGEPSTLVEVLIGVGIIAAYLVFARPMRGGRSVQRISKPTGAGRGRKAA